MEPEMKSSQGPLYVRSPYSLSLSFFPFLDLGGYIELKAWMAA